MIIQTIQWLYVINLFTAGIVAGGLIHAWKLIVGGLRELPQVTQVRVHQGMLFLTPDRFMQPCGLTAAGTGIALLILQIIQDGPLNVSALTIASDVFLVLGLLGNLGVAITSRYFGTRINAIIATWSLDAIPPEYPAMRRKWDKTHFIRMSCGITAFLGYLLGFLTFKLAMAGESEASTIEATALLLAALLFCNLVAMAVLAGTRAMVTLNIIPEKYKMPKVMAMQTHHAMFDLKKDSFMKPTGIFCGLSLLAIVVILGVEKRLTIPQAAVYAIGLAGVLVVVVTANRFLVPLHTKILTWSVESPPPEYDDRMQAFQKVMNLQLVASCVAFLCVVVAGIILV